MRIDPRDGIDVHLGSIDLATTIVEVGEVVDIMRRGDDVWSLFTLGGTRFLGPRFARFRIPMGATIKSAFRMDTSKNVSTTCRGSETRANARHALGRGEAVESMRVTVAAIRCSARPCGCLSRACQRTYRAARQMTANPSLQKSPSKEWCSSPKACC